MRVSIFKSRAIGLTLPLFLFDFGHMNYAGMGHDNRNKPNRVSQKKRRLNQRRKGYK